MYVLDRQLLQGGMKFNRKPYKRVPRVPMPTYISLHHKNIELNFYLLYMNGMPFLHTKSFLTSENCTSNSA